jgi:hypothetical protein
MYTSKMFRVGIFGANTTNVSYNASVILL